MIGIDEVGRGSLIGPVVACAVYEDIRLLFCPTIIKDSKQISQKQRLLTYEIVTKNCHFAIGSASLDEIEEINILNASLLACKRAFDELIVVLGQVNMQDEVKLVVIDGIHSPKFGIPTKCLIQGDVKNIFISTASIIAKVHRDNLICSYQDKIYGWSKNKGYGTRNHIDAIIKYGLSSYHRPSFCKKYVT